MNESADVSVRYLVKKTGIPKRLEVLALECLSNILEQVMALPQSV